MYFLNIYLQQHPSKILQAFSYNIEMLELPKKKKILEIIFIQIKNENFLHKLCISFLAFYFISFKCTVQYIG